MMQVLHDLIEELERERSVLDERIRLAAELLNTYNPLDTMTHVEPAPVVAPGEVKKKGPKIVDGKVQQVACPDCGLMFHPNGLGPHRGRKHPGSAAKPLQSVPARQADRDPRDTFGDEFYACGTCNHEEPNEAGIRGHTMRMHNRPATDVERKAIAA